MIQPSRRRFLATTGAGAAAVGAAAIVPTVLASSPHKAQQTPEPQSNQPETPQDASGSLLAYVADVHGDTVTFMVGERDVIVRDNELVARLANAAF